MLRNIIMPHVIENGIILQSTDLGDHNNSGSAIYNKNGELVLQQRNNEFCDVKTWNSKCIDTEIKEENKYDFPCIYMGQLTNHYGHFLLESLCRFWIFLEEYKDLIKNRSNYKYVFTDFVTMTTPIISDNILLKTICNILKININDFILIKNKSSFSEIVLYEPSVCINEKMDIRFKKLCDSISQNIVENTIDDNKLLRSKEIFQTPYIYIVRKCIKEEKAIIDVMKKHNFFIMIPRIETFKEDVLKYSNTSIMVALEGSCAHNIIFSKPNTEILIINWRNRITTNQIKCNILSLSNVNVIDMNNEHFLTNLNTKVVSMMENNNSKNNNN